MPKIKSSALRLIVDNKPRKNNPAHTSSNDIGRKLLRYHDSKEAMHIIEEQAGLEFDAQHGGKIPKLQQDANEQDARYKISLKTLHALDQEKSGTRCYIKSCSLHTGSDNEPITFKNWLGKDKILFLVILACLITAVGMGAGNVYANLMSSGNPVFIKSPWLARMLAALLPIASITVKFVTNFMSLDTSRKRYAIAVYSLTLITLLVWSVLFATNFSGISGSIDWDALENAGNSGPALVWSQLLLEILIGAALFLAAEDIYMRYSPDVYVESPKYLVIKTALKSHLSAHEALCTRRGDIRGRLEALLAERQASINHKLADYVSMRARIDAAGDIL